MNNNFNLSKFITSVRDDVTIRLQKKTSWGRVGIMEEFNNSINDVLITMIADHIVVDGEDNDFSWVYEEDQESRQDKAKRIADNLKNKLTNKKADIESKKTVIDNEITSKQLYAINKIETTLAELEVKFEGSNKFDAINFISKYIGKSVEDILPRGIF